MIQYVYETELRKVGFPVAGFSKRFLPATKAKPQERHPLKDKPLIQYAAGIDTLIFVRGHTKRAIEDHLTTIQS